MFFQEKKEELAIWAVDKLTQNYPKGTLWRFFGAGFAVNVISWVVPLILPSFLADPAGMAISIESRIGIYLMLIPFTSAALMVFSLIRIVAPTPTYKKRKDDVFSLYEEKSVSDRDRRIFLISLGCGAANCILLYFVIIWVRVAVHP